MRVTPRKSNKIQPRTRTIVRNNSAGSPFRADRTPEYPSLAKGPSVQQNVRLHTVFWETYKKMLLEKTTSDCKILHMDPLQRLREIEGILLEEVRVAREGYRNGNPERNEYSRALRRFSRFVLDAEVPPDLQHLLNRAVQGELEPAPPARHLRARSATAAA